jgi:hypothetical protein
MTYAQKLAKRNRLKYVLVDRIYIGDYDTWIETSGDGKWKLKSKNASMEIDEDGINISGSLIINNDLRIKQNLNVDGHVTCDKIEASKYNEKEES